MIGKLNKKVDIKLQTDEPSDFDGGVDETFQVVARVWASIDNVSSGQYLGRAQIGEAITHYIEIRHFKGLGLHHVIDYGSRRFEIRRIREKDDKGRFMLLECEEITDY